MWRRVCKEELRQQKPVYLVIFGLLAVSGVFGLLASGEPAAFSAMNGSHWLNLFSMMGIYVLWVGSLIFFTVYTIYRFSKSVFGREGAFWMTLPASPRQVLFGKLAAPLVWLAGMALLAAAGGMLFMAAPLFSEGISFFSMRTWESGAMIACILAAQFLFWMGTIYGICFAVAAGHLPRFRRYAFWAAVGFALLLFFVAEPLAALLLQGMIGLAAVGLYAIDGIPAGAFYAAVAMVPVVMLLRMGLYVGLTLYLGEKKLDYLS